MTAIIRLWLAFAALGAGMIHIAVGASAPFPLALLLVGFGVAELGWGVAVLVRGRLLLMQAVLGAALIPVFIWGATATLGSGLGVAPEATGLPVHPMAVASLFNLVVAGGIALHLRRSTAAPARVAVGVTSVGRMQSTATGIAGPTADDTPEGARPAADAQGWRFLTALTLGAILFSGLTTPALAATDAGQLAVPHGTSHQH